MRISVIVTTFNRPDALNLVLQSLVQQSDKEFELVVADDGSKDDTRRFIETFQGLFSQPLLHVWHEDKGFRAAAIRNLAVSQSSGDYLIFLDGDCIAQHDFISRHRALVQVKHMVTGSRALLDPTLTQTLLDARVWDFSAFKRQLFRFRITGRINKYLAFYLKLSTSYFRYQTGFNWRRIKGCNFACWRSDFDLVNGFDETFEGWGHEDADLVLRMHHQGIKIKSGAFATEVLHLHHPENNRANAQKNKLMLLERIAKFT